MQFTIRKSINMIKKKKTLTISIDAENVLDTKNQDSLITKLSKYRDKSKQ